MKQRDLVKLFERNGWQLIREGANHMVYAKNGVMETVPRHREINEQLAKAIIKRRNLQ